MEANREKVIMGDVLTLYYLKETPKESKTMKETKQRQQWQQTKLPNKSISKQKKKTDTRKPTSLFIARRTFSNRAFSS